MIDSMTGFGKGRAAGENIAIGIEIKSVNHRFCDVNVKGPRVAMPLEGILKKKVSESLSRGKIDIFINLEIIGEQAYEARINKPLADALVRSLNKLQKAYGLDDKVSLDLLVGQKDVLQFSESISLDELRPCLEQALDEALLQIRQMRRSEGEALQVDFEQRLEKLDSLIGRVAERAPQVPLEWQEKLRQRLERYAADVDIEPQRIAQELAVFADRCDISEELTRFRSHLVQFRGLFDAEEPVGRKMDFLVQEINRETNTIGSKANDAVIGSQVVEIKAELEKIREQVQNVA
ncbi:YicC family protein [Geothermobacter hydrogeniphilus]|uniref:YicC family protein n=1 Tax=Geothermobacter hydrogeniphilus TaxID=1969733 RepID=A0A2K2HCA1_9BACT|nr:YicC/YloC family endoribonuclease [Geothermobacter hydrogeniphilus]PNU20938.1 YicC family protein [Geothermobacter hydrogeniphilus]